MVRCQVSCDIYCYQKTLCLWTFTDIYQSVVIVSFFHNKNVLRQTYPKGKDYLYSTHWSQLMYVMYEFYLNNLQIDKKYILDVILHVMDKPCPEPFSFSGDCSYLHPRTKLLTRIVLALCQLWTVLTLSDTEWSISLPECPYSKSPHSIFTPRWVSLFFCFNIFQAHGMISAISSKYKSFCPSFWFFMDTGFFMDTVGQGKVNRSLG